MEPLTGRKLPFSNPARPMTAQDESRPIQDGPKTAQDPQRAPKSRPRPRQDPPKDSLRLTKTIKNRPKTPPKRSNIGPRPRRQKTTTKHNTTQQNTTSTAHNTTQQNATQHRTQRNTQHNTATPNTGQHNTPLLHTTLGGSYSTGASWAALGTVLGRSGFSAGWPWGREKRSGGGSGGVQGPGARNARKHTHAYLS